jgi:hypothetical protein
MEFRIVDFGLRIEFVRQDPQSAIRDPQLWRSL